MNKNISTLLTIILTSVVLLTACNSQVTAVPSAAPIPTATEIPAPSPTSTPQPVSLIGKILLVGNTSTPLTSSIELHNKDNFTLVAIGDTDSEGVYQIDNINAGTYELWVLITPVKGMVPNCADVAPPTADWKMGIQFSDDTAIILPDALLTRALIFAQVRQSSDLEAQGFYAVLEDFVVEPEIENEKNVILLCKPK